LINTKVIKINSFQPEKTKINKAVKIIQSGGLVAFPTETIYGLGADALNEKAVEKIFKAKGRPQDNPLIIHIADKKDLRKYVSCIPKKAKTLIDKFWPGPLAIVFKKNKIIPDRTTCGLKSAAIRMPSNKIALKLIKQSGVPIAAPSANYSGKPSPSKASHVIDDLNGKIDLIINGGKTTIGLESTVISLVNEPVLLRPGRISKEQIEKEIGKIEIHKGVFNMIKGNEKAESPGLKYRHYSPKAKVILVTGKYSKEKIKELFKQYRKENLKVKILACNNKKKLAKNLFSKFRECDKKNIDIILVNSINEKGIGMAIMNRLRKSASKIIKA
jgi:L-threonylcarbamoyladenylate synthase